MLESRLESQAIFSESMNPKFYLHVHLESIIRMRKRNKVLQIMRQADYKTLL